LSHCKSRAPSCSRLTTPTRSVSSCKKAEQQRIALAKAGAERRLADAQASGQHLEHQLDRVLALLGQAYEHHLGSTGQARRDLNEGVFERIYLDDDKVVGSDLTPVFQRLLSKDLDESLAKSGAARPHDLEPASCSSCPA
jgi:hypothetical protein